MTRRAPQTDTLSREQMGMVFQEIANTADVVKDLLGIIIVESLDDPRESAAVASAAEMLTRRMGLLAELYGERCGAPYPQVRGGADEWLMQHGFREVADDGRPPVDRADDPAGRYLDGGKTYRLHLPPNIPMNTGIPLWKLI